MQLMSLGGIEEHGNATRIDPLPKSGLMDNRVAKDLNILESSIKESAHHLRIDNLQLALDDHFGLDSPEESKRKGQADGCTIASLLLMNAAMLYQRIANGKWLPNVISPDTLKKDGNVVRNLCREWERIMRHDFRPILEPALATIYVIESTGKTTGMESAIHHIITEAERIAESYADMGADHAGPLFNDVMSNQASDGAFFTRPVAASIAARLTLDACGEQDWTNPQVWRDHKTVDIACGSGALLAAMLTDMKRRAREQGASKSRITELQKLAVEEIIKGLDINIISLQLAASQLTAFNSDIRYRNMGLHLMPYGPQKDNPGRVSAGSLELLGQKAIVPRNNELNLDDDRIDSLSICEQQNDTDDAVDAAQNARIVIMNPPFTNRAKMGEKFSKEIQQALRSRVDNVERVLVRNDNALKDIVYKNSVGPLFTALADRCVMDERGVLTMVKPTIALSNISGIHERLILAQRYHIHTILTCHQTYNVNLSQQSGINESIIVATRHKGIKPRTRIINMDKFPTDEGEVADLHKCIVNCTEGLLDNGWGEVSHWPADRIDVGDWTPAIWRSPDLAEAAYQFANDENLPTIKQSGLSVHQTGREIYSLFERGSIDAPNAFPIVKSKGADGQSSIRSSPDEYWVPKKGYGSIDVDNFLKKGEHLLITEGQYNRTSRLVAVADDRKHVGGGWMPVEGLTAEESKSMAIFLNSTAGRLQIMRNAGKTLTFPAYRPAGMSTIRIPDIKNCHIRRILADCWERTKDVVVPQFRDGECEVRRLWDEAVADAMGWDAEYLAHLRQLLHHEPHVRSLAYNQYADEPEDHT